MAAAAISVSMSSHFRKTLHTALLAMFSTPEQLEEKKSILGDFITRLTSHCDSSGQGSANAVTPHEACIAKTLESFDITLAPERNIIPSVNGYYFWYQAGGSQQKGDFTVFSAEDGSIVDSLILDAKHSNNTKIYLNDGTFELDVIYIMSITITLPRIRGGPRKGERKNICIVGLGRDIMTESERNAITVWREKLRELNSTLAPMLTSDSESLTLYARSANQYDCKKRFSDEITLSCLRNITTLLNPPVH